MAVNWNDFEPIDPATNAAPKRPAAVDWSQFEPIKPNTDGQAVSGFKRSFEEIPGSVAAIGAYGADLVGATGVRDSLLSYAKRRDEEVGARHQNDAASFTDAWDGKVPLPDFLANTGGYVAGQVLQSIATGGLGAIGAKMLAKQGIKELAETTAAKAIAAGASEEAAKKAVTEAVVAAGTKAMTRGAAVGAGAHNFGMELGTIYPAAVEEAGGADNLDGGDKFRVFAAAGLAAGVDTAGEAIMAGRILRGSKAGSKTTGIIGRAAREVPAGMVREGATEAVQTGLEHYGAGQPIADEKGRRDIIDSAATGAFGGGLGGGLAATHRRKVPEAPSPSPITKGLQGIAAATNIEDAIGAAAAAISPQKQAPTPLELATEELRGAGVMDAIRERFGAEGASGLLNSLAQAGNPRATPEVRALHQQVVDEMLFWLRASRDQQAQDQLALPAPGGQPQIGMAPRAPELGMGSTPTGTLRVGPDGVVVPETVADLSQPQVRPDGMTATVPRGGEPGAGVMVGQGTLTPGASIPAARTPLLQRIEDLRRKPESAEPVATAPPPIAPSAAALQTASWAAQQHLAEVNRAIKAGTLPAPVPAPAIEPIAPPPAPNQPAASPGQAEEAQGAGAPIEAEKPRVFRSRANAIAERDRLGNEHKLQKIKGGYILRRKTDAEFAAENAGARRLSSGAASGTRRSLLSTLAAGGGINLSERADTIGEGNRNVGGRMLFTRAGKSIHQWAEALAESGFIPPSEVADDGGVRWLQEAIQNEYSGIREHFAMNDQERMDELARELMGEEPVDPLAPFDDDELGESGYSAASPEVQAVTEAMLADAEASGIDTETIREDAARKTEGQSADAYHEAVQLAVAQALVAHRRAAGEADASAARGSSEDHGEAAGNQGAQEQGLRLEAQTPEDLRAKAEREAAGAEAERANQRELAARAAAETRRKNKAEEDARADRVRKERADAAREDFQLGQEPPSAKVSHDEAAGQRGVFDAPSDEQVEQAPTAPPHPETSKIEDVGEKIGGARKDTAESGGTRPNRSNEDDGRPTWARRFKISQIVRAGGQINAPRDEGRWVINDSRSLDWMGQPKQVGRNTYATKEEAEAAVPLAAVSLKHRVVTTSGGKYEIWRDITDRKRVKVVDKTFDTRDEAMIYLAAHAAEILETNTTFGEADLPLPPDRDRSGPARRNGNVTGDDFKNTFGFRGVEFGNWNNQDERQALMNDAWDGLMDLADVLGVPPKALGLNGDLALAFGARGHGLNSARAHYALDRAVINLTKERGAGSLAHEWLHALDHYFGRQDGKASAEWVTQKDGTRVLNAADPERSFVSHGFRGERSGVRPELRAAYENVMRVMSRRAEGYVEDTAKVERFTAATRDELTQQLDGLRAELSAQKDVRYYRRNNKPASAEQLAEFDTIAKAMLDGKLLDTDWRTIGDTSVRARVARARVSSRWTNDTLERLSAIHKEVRGRSGFDSTSRNGTLDRLRGAMERYSQRLKMLAEARSGTEKTRSVPTEFARDARELDQGRGTDYWTTPHEMAARAFQGYVEDKVAERGDVSRFLNYAPANVGILTPWGFKRPFPAGQERVAINKAFDAFVGELKTRETERGTAVYSRTGSSVPLPVGDRVSEAAAADEVQQRIERFHHQPPIRIRESALGELPGATVDDRVSGAVHQGAIYLFLDRLADRRDVQRALFHELLHYGLRRFLTREQYEAQMLRLYERDASIRRFADAWAAGKDGDNAHSFGGDSYALARGVDEALALLAEPNAGEYLQRGVLARAYRSVLSWLAELAESLGFRSIAAELRGVKNEEARTLIRSVFTRLESDAPATTDAWGFFADQAFASDAPREVTYTITKVGRKWLEGKQAGKPYTNQIEINDASRDWKVGETVTFQARTEFTQSRYGATVQVFPVSAEQAQAQRAQVADERALADLRRQLGFIEDSAAQGRRYDNGIEKARALGIDRFPAEKARLDAALAKVRAADAVPRAYLNVPYAEKDAAKARGARWDPERRQWYVRGEVPDALRKYLPGQATQQTKQPDGDPAAAGQITLSMGSGYGGRPYAVGETLRNPAHARDAARPEFVTITSASQRYYRYDGMSFGVGDEQGYVYMAKARPATEQEAAPVVERERKAAERRERIRAVDALRLTFTQQGEVPKSADPRGETLLDSFNLYGGGERWVIDRDGGAIWYVRNNGADGDNWAQNNVVTGGAGAIGWRMPWTQQAEQTLRDAAGDAALAVYEPDATYDVAARAGQADNAPYETDLFGAPLPQAAGKNRSARPEGAGVRGNVQPKPAVPGDTQAPPGDYYAPTVVGVVTQRKLGAKRINSPKEAAQATQYLYESAVERFDGIVTDKDGKPLAVVGGFKGALSQTNVYTSTLVGEAVRVPGAARIWFSHNHPSGTAELSRADEHINNLLTDVFAGSGIEPMGMLAIGNNGYGYVGPTQGSNGLRESGAIQAPSDAGVVVPVIERVATRPAQTKPMVGDPAQAKAAATAYYSSGGNQPGLILLDAQHGITAWVPIQSGMTGRLRATGGLNAIYRAVSESNAGAAIIVHGGELDAVVAGGVSASQNIAAALRRLDVRPLDSINAKTGESAAESGRVIDQGPMYSQGAGSRTSLESLRAALRREIGADVIDAIERAGVLTLTERPADAPAGAVGETRGERMWLYPGADVSVAYHEALHAALRRLIGDEAFERLMARMPLLAAGNRKWFADAAERVPAGTPARVRNEELASYAVEQYQRAREAMPAGVRKWVQELIAALKAGLAKALQAAGIGLRLRVKLMGDAAVLHKLARDGLRTMAREERAASHADLVPAFSRTDQSQTPEANALKALSENDELFALPKSKATAVEEIAKDIDPQIKVAAPIKHGLETWYKFTMPDGAVARMVVREPNPYGANVYSATQNEAGDYDWNPVRAGENPDDVPQDKADVWIDVSGLKTGGGGAKIYAIAGDYAHNTGRMFIGDPSGVSDIAMRRRPEQMLSSALRWGTTEHLAPHPDQDKGNSKIGVPPLRWVYGDDIGNINRLIDLNLQALDNAFPGAREVEFDAESGQFRVTESGRVIGREALGRRLDQLRSDSDSAVASAALGGTTLARGLVLRSLLREARGGGAAAGGRDGVLARIARLRSDPESQTHRLFSISDQVADLPPSGVEKVRGRIAAETPAGRRRRAQDLIDAKGGVFDFNRLGETKQDRIRAIVDGARKFWLGAVTRDQIADMYGDEIPPVREYDRLTREMENERAKRAQDADELYNEWAKLPAAVNARLADIMADATINQVHPDREFALPDGVARGSREDILFRLANAERSATHKRLAAEYAALPADAKEMYQRVKGYHEQTLADLRAAIEARLMRQVEDGAARAATLSLIRQKFDKYLGTGPYFPLSRFGDYLVIANNDEVDGDRFVASYGNAGEQQAAARALEAEGYTVKTTVAKAYSRTDDGAATKFIGDVLTAVDKLDFTDADFEDKKADLKGKLLDDINQLFIKALPDISYRKHFQHRKGTPGFSSDMMRGFASSAFHAAAHIARLNHGDKMTFALADAFQTISDAPEGDFGKAAQVLNELLKRHDAMLNPDTHPLSAMLSQLGFVMYLGLSPAAGIVNMLQTVMVTMPHLGARYGFAKANASLAKAYKDILAAPMNGKNGWNAAQSMKLSVSERAMMTQLQDEGVIDLTQAHELAAATTLDTGNVARSKAAFAMSRAMKIFGWTFHVPEVMNRQVTALAAYRMEMQKSGDVAKAKDAAREAIKRTHFDYSASNTSRYMQGNVARVIFQFKKYSQNMTYLLGRALHQALKGETPEVKAIARRQLLATLGVTWAMAGALGLPAVGSVAGLLGLFLSALSDDDEPWDWKTEFRNLMADTFGKEAGEVISHGVPRALMPWDISNRTGLADLWWRSNDRAEQSPREAFASDFTNNILGPTIGGYSLGLYTAADHMAKGHWSKAVESIVPKAMRDPLKALREYNEGVTNYNGEQIMDVNGLEVLGRVIGFAPARASEMYEARNAVKNAEATLDERRSMLLDGMVKARMSGDGQAAGALQAEITQFNQRHPEFRITGDSVIKSLLAKRRALAETEDGYRLSRSRESLRSLGRFANSGPEQ